MSAATSAAAPTVMSAATSAAVPTAMFTARHDNVRGRWQYTWRCPRLSTVMAAATRTRKTTAKKMKPTTRKGNENKIIRARDLKHENENEYENRNKLKIKAIVHIIERTRKQPTKTNTNTQTHTRHTLNLLRVLLTVIRDGPKKTNCSKKARRRANKPTNIPNQLRPRSSPPPPSFYVRFQHLIFLQPLPPGFSLPVFRIPRVKCHHDRPFFTVCRTCYESPSLTVGGYLFEYSSCPPIVQARTSRKHRHYSGNQHYSAYCHYCLVVPICANRFDRHYSGQPAPRNRHHL